MIDTTEKNNGLNTEAKEDVQYLLKLFITGATPNSIKAVNNIKEICEVHLKDRYRLEIIDVYQEVMLAEKEQLIALPMLIKKFPAPERRIIGDMSNESKVLLALGLPDNGR